MYWQGWLARNGRIERRCYTKKRSSSSRFRRWQVWPLSELPRPKKEASWAIIGVAGFLGIAEKLVAIPMDQLTLTTDGGVHYLTT